MILAVDLRDLSTTIPDVDVLIALEPDELGKRILFMLRARPSNEAMIHPSQWRHDLAALYSGALSSYQSRPIEVEPRL